MINLPNRNITDYLFEFAGKNPAKPALLHPVKITYLEFCKTIDRYVGRLRKEGIGKGTRTIILIKPGPDLFAVTFALFKLGAIPVMIDPGMGIKAMTNALGKAEAEVLIGIPRSMLLKLFARKSLLTVKKWIPTGRCWFFMGKGLKCYLHEKVKGEKACRMHPEDLTAIFFTSGSTGLPKGVLYQNYMFHAQLNYLRSHFGYHPDETDLCTFPLIGLFSLCMGLSLVLADMDMTRPARLNPRKLIQNIKDYHCTYMFCSPLVLRKLATEYTKKQQKLHSLKKVISAGAPISENLLKSFKPLLNEEAKIHTPYGATEALPLTDICDSELMNLYNTSDNRLEGVCVGYPLNGISLKILTISDVPVLNIEEAEFLNAGEVGEIVVKGQNVSLKYLNDEQANLLSKIGEKGENLIWHRTGDLACLDSKGRLWFYGRKSQRVVTKNKTLFTVSCEKVFSTHPKVFRTALVGVRSGNNDDVIPVICVELVKNVKRTVDLKNQLLQIARGNPTTKDIRIILFHKKFPVDPRHNAKIYREKLAVWAQNRIR